MNQNQQNSNGFVDTFLSKLKEQSFTQRDEFIQDLKQNN